MVSTVVIFCCILPALCSVIPAVCHTEIQVIQVTRYGTVCHTEPEQVCRTRYDTEYETGGYRQECGQTCRTGHKTVHRKECSTVYQEDCQKTGYQTQCDLVCDGPLLLFMDMQKCQTEE